MEVSTFYSRHQQHRCLSFLLHLVLQNVAREEDDAVIQRELTVARWQCSLADRMQMKPEQKRRRRREEMVQTIYIFRPFNCTKCTSAKNTDYVADSRPGTNIKMYVHGLRQLDRQQTGGQQRSHPAAAARKEARKEASSTC